MADIKFIEGDPPPALRGSSRRDEWDDAIKQLRAHPGEWAVLLEGDRKKVEATRTFLASTYGGCKFTVRRTGETTSTVYGVFGTPKEKPTA